TLYLPPLPILPPNFFLTRACAPQLFSAPVRALNRAVALARSARPGSAINRPPATAAVKHSLQAAESCSLATDNGRLRTTNPVQARLARCEVSRPVDGFSNPRRVTRTAAVAAA